MNTIAFVTLFIADAVLLRFWQIDTGSKLILALLALLAWAGAGVAARRGF
jgi:hypothetical protein